MIGAFRGMSNIPEDWVSKVVNTHPDNKRPDFLKTLSMENICGLIDQLLENSPWDETFIIE